MCSLKSVVRLIATLIATYCVASQAASDETIVATIQDFRDGISSVHVRKGEMKIQVVKDSGAPDQTVLQVDYPAASRDPGARDVWCDAIDKDWREGSAISFMVKPVKDLRLSISFLGRNRVAYTTWADLKGGEWQTVRVKLDEIQPNPFFQPPGADKNSPMDVSEITRIGFAPQSPEAGQVLVGRFVVMK